MKSSRYYIGSYKKANQKGLILEFLFYYKLKCSVGCKRLSPKIFHKTLKLKAGISEITSKRNIPKLLKCGFLEIKEDLKGRDYYQIISPERVARLLGVDVKFYKIKKTNYNKGYKPYKWQYSHITIRNEKRNISISKILSCELKFNKSKQNYRVREQSRVGGLVKIYLNKVGYREHEMQSTSLYRTPADIIISNKTTANLLGYKSQSQGNIITRKLLTNKKAKEVITNPVELVASDVSKEDFFKNFKTDKFFYCSNNSSVYSRDCSHIFLF